MADLVSGCSTNFSGCNVYENSKLTFPFRCGIAGDVILQEPNGSVSDVFRIFNDFVDTGGGTGLGLTAFLYSLDDGNLPSPATYSRNAVFFPESQVVVNGLTETDFTGNGTLYRLFSAPAPVPEPSGWALLGTVTVAAGGLARKRRRNHSGARAG
jgi:hypothetical protein